MNRLAAAMRIRIFECLTEGCGINTTARLCDVSKNTVLRLLKAVGWFSQLTHHMYMQGLACEELQCDEITCFVTGRSKNIGYDTSGGERYTWLAIDPKTKLVVSHWTGKRTKKDAQQFLDDVRFRVKGQPRISTDAFAAYEGAVAQAFGANGRHRVFRAKDDYGHGAKVFTNSVERMNLTLRTSNSRFRRKTLGFSKSFDHHVHSIAISICHYNFGRIHKTLRVTPAMEAGITDHVWSAHEFV